jgi:hypothetical protein
MSDAQQKAKRLERPKAWIGYLVWLWFNEQRNSLTKSLQPGMWYSMKDVVRLYMMARRSLVRSVLHSFVPRDLVNTIIEPDSVEHEPAKAFEKAWRLPSHPWSFSIPKRLTYQPAQTVHGVFCCLRDVVINLLCSFWRMAFSCHYGISCYLLICLIDDWST